MNVKDVDSDHVILLDAARTDLYESVNGETETRRTVGSCSKEFVHKTFQNPGEWSETVVITANPHYSDRVFREGVGNTPDETFHDFYSTHRMSPEDMVVDNCYAAENVFKLVEKALEDYDSGKKSFLIHFMQPHVPFLQSDTFDEVGVNLWQLVKKGMVDEDEVWPEYIENLEYVMPFAEDCVDLLEGPVAITADHGNALGEEGQYGHPYGSDVDAVREVPLDVRQ